ncbi:putative non-specific serine/threonine protein kinase [Helianthus debilis subsp. tardiflorus]
MSLNQLQKSQLLPHRFSFQINFYRLLLSGCFIQGPENMLVYEYLRNKSLDYIRFDKQKSPSLHWT